MNATHHAPARGRARRCWPPPCSPAARARRSTTPRRRSRRRSAGGRRRGGAGGGTGGTAQSQVAPVDLTKTDNAALSSLPRVVYFDFDSFVVKDEFRPIVEAQRQGAGRRPQEASLPIEGHTDERGGREYNLALGQKRAEAVAKSLALLGVTDARSRR